MKSDKELAEYIFDIFRAAHCNKGHKGQGTGT